MTYQPSSQWRIVSPFMRGTVVSDDFVFKMAPTYYLAWVRPLPPSFIFKRITHTVSDLIAQGFYESPDDAETFISSMKG